MENILELLNKAQRGDKNAFGQIYKIYFNRIYRYCRIHLKSDDAAQDLTQETFYKAWKAIHTFKIDSKGSIQAFLFKIARNNIIDLSRKKAEFSLEYAMEVESKDNFEDEFDKKSNIETVQKALTKLKEEERHMVVLRYFEEVSNADIAKIFKSNEGAVRVKLHRILKKLKGILNEK